jgi:molybdopterin/thiamine biosynthesis adenylyltransferase
MADKTTIAPNNGLNIIVRAASPEVTELWKLLFKRYPDMEWATFARFGWRETSDGLVLTLQSLITPEEEDLDKRAGHVIINEPYTLRVALDAETHQFAVGVIHSHPEGSWTTPSYIDDDMDTYYAPYFSDFAPDRPYASLIFARNEQGTLSGTGRVFWNNQWHSVKRFVFEGHHITVRTYDFPSNLSPHTQAQVERLTSAFGKEAAERLAGASVAVIGAGGTGSPAIEVLARAGVGHIIIVDPDTLSESNLERVHGSIREFLGMPKVEVARRHVQSINPACRVTAIQGSLPQPEVIDHIITADAILGCTDQQHSRVALSDVVLRYLLPGIDCGVSLEGNDGKVSGQVIQLVRFLPTDPCVYCRGMVIDWKVAQELMAEEEKQQRQAAAMANNDPANPYWRNMAQLNTVGYLTTTAGSMAAGYIIGWLTGRFVPPFQRLQLDLVAYQLGPGSFDDIRRPECACNHMRGTADQGSQFSFISPPSHWPNPLFLTT